MIAGFHSETSPLTEYERTVILPRMVAGFYRIAGTGHKLTNAKMREIILKEGIDASDVRVRKVINHIRTHDLVIGLCGKSPDGYWVENDPDKFMEYIKSLQSRIDSIQNMHDKLLNQHKKMLNEKIKNPSHQVDLFGAAKVGKDALDNGAGLGGRQALLDTPEPGQNQTIASNAPKTRQILAVEAWWKSENQIQSGR